MSNTIAQKGSKQRTLQNVETIKYTIDAKGKALGRVASDAASALLGKKSAHYVQNFVLPVEVTIINADKLALHESRTAAKTYTRYTGYPGGLRTTPMKMMIDKKGIEEVVRKTVDGMLPRNKLRKDRMKRLFVTVS
jgi:large subunit ribosomal protein L13